MRLRLATDIEYIFLLLLAIAVGFMAALYTGNRLFHGTQISFTLPADQVAQNVNEAPAMLHPQETFQISPDGTEKLTQTLNINKDLSKTYTLTASGIDGSNPQILATETLKEGSMSIPFNTWSPDNNYVFVNIASSSGAEALVMKANGDPITGTQRTLNVTSLFKARNTGNLYDETTGWASETLLIINSKMPDGSKGPSYWFEVPSQAIIELSTQF